MPAGRSTTRRGPTPTRATRTRPAAEDAAEPLPSLLAVIDHLPLFYLVIEGDGHVTGAGGRALESLGYRAGELNDRPVGDLSGRVRLLIEHALLTFTGAARTTVWQEHGRTFTIQNVPLRDGVGGPTRMLVLGSEVADPAAAAMPLLDEPRRSPRLPPARPRRRHEPAESPMSRRTFIERLGATLAGANRRHQRLAVALLTLRRTGSDARGEGGSSTEGASAALVERMRACLRPGDLVATYDREMFAILVTQFSSTADLTRIAGRLLRCLDQPYLVDGEEISVEGNIGFAASRPPETTAADLLRDADIALYHARAAGPARAIVFDSRMLSGAEARLDLLTDLWGAAQRDELRLHFQPEIDVRTGAVVGLEALVRWQHPRYGLIMPEAFIGIAEESGLILPIGQWVLEEACREAARFHLDRAGGAPLVVSVNLSPVQFRQPELISQVRLALRESGLPPTCLRLEITENVLLGDVEVVAQTISQLQALGVSVAFDDFGVGYSSLNYLRRFPVGALKIDRSFIATVAADGRTLAIIQAMTALAHALGMEVVAEGVETAEQLAFMRAVQCDRVQGFYFSEPLPSDRLRERRMLG